MTSTNTTSSEITETVPIEMVPDTEIPADTTNAAATTVSESESNDSSSDNESAESKAITSSTSADTQEPEQDQEDLQESTEYEDDVLEEVRTMIATGMSDLSHKDRIQITGELHGINQMGLSPEEEMEPHITGLLLKQFQDALDRSSSVNTAIYELCLRNNYYYATNHSGELRIMCLRAELWNPIKACERFLKHISALHMYYGEDGLKQPLDIDLLDYEERNCPSISSKSKRNASEKGEKEKSAGKKATRGMYKKGKGRSKRKGSLDSLPDMLALKSGCIQVLPSRDRSGRRVVILQPGPSIATSLQTQFQVQTSKVR